MSGSDLENNAEGLNGVSAGGVEPFVADPSTFLPESPHAKNGIGHTAVWWGGGLLLLILVLAIGSMDVAPREREAVRADAEPNAISNTVQPSSDIFDTALKAEREGRWEEAVVAYRQIVTDDPESARGQYGLGEVWAKLGEYRNAESALRKAIKIDPRYALAHDRLGTVLSKLGRYEDAASSYKHCLALDSEYVPAFYHLAEAYENLKLWKKASVAYKLGLSHDLGNEAGYRKLARAYRKLGKTKKANVASYRADQLALLSERG